MEAENYEIHGHVQLQPENVRESDTGYLAQRLSLKDSTAEKDMVKDGSRLEARFRHAMCHEFQVADRYTNVGVLIVSWAEGLDNLKCGAEVEELHNLFQHDFGFSSRVEKLNTEKSPQNQLNYAVQRLIKEHDGPPRRNLLIIYYSGHGSGKKDSHELEFFGTPIVNSAYPTDVSGYPARAEWTRAESPLNYAEADVLTILDCCCAANIIKKGGQANHRCHELLTAVGRSELANRPGPESFTRHFIDAMEDQLKTNNRQPFTTFELDVAIKRRRQIFSSSLMARHGGTWTGRHISLAPLDQNIADDVASSTVYHRTGKTATLDLRLVFRTDAMMAEEQASFLATKLSQAAKAANDDGKGDMGLHSIEWLGYRPSFSTIMIRHARHLYVRNVCLKRWAKRWYKKRSAHRKRKAKDDPTVAVSKKRATGTGEDMLTPNSLASRNASPS